MRPRLSWSVPRRLPHGPVGAALVSLGGIEMTNAFQGHLVSPPVAVALAALTVANAASGVALLPDVCRVDSCKLFKATSLVQYCLSYELVRFSLDFGAAAAPLDAMCGCFLLASLLSMARDASVFPGAVRYVILLGTVAASTFVIYPFQMALDSADWYQLLGCWPDQHAAMATYVYGPACVLVAVIMFCATLFERDLIGGRSLAFVATLMPLTLVATVIAQDVYFGTSSTQQLILGVPETDPVQLLNILRF